MGWHISNHWTRSQTLRNLWDPRYGDYARRFGFQQGVLPSEGRVGYFLTTLGRHSEKDGQTMVVEKKWADHSGGLIMLVSFDRPICRIEPLRRSAQPTNLGTGLDLSRRATP
jgi:hypothetical protein